MISFIVSVYDRVPSLNACLASLRTQSGDHEIIVCANHDNPDKLRALELACMYFDAPMFRTGDLGSKNCYDSANTMAMQAKGEWLCFPSDDSLYVAGFSDIMLGEARLSQADLIYCDCVYRAGSQQSEWKAYSVLDSEPKMGRIDKTNFIVKRELFRGFPPHPKGWRDGAMIEDLVQRGVKTSKAPGVLCLHQ